MKNQASPCSSHVSMGKLSIFFHLSMDFHGQKLHFLKPRDWSRPCSRCHWRPSAKRHLRRSTAGPGPPATPLAHRSWVPRDDGFKASKTWGKNLENMNKVRKKLRKYGKVKACVFLGEFVILCLSFTWNWPWIHQHLIQNSCGILVNQPESSSMCF